MIYFLIISEINISKMKSHIEIDYRHLIISIKLLMTTSI